MRVLPSTVHGFRSNAEQKVFDLLQATDLGPNAFALHSLNLSRHDYKRWAEVDFVVAWEEGVFALEVKGGRVACTSGIWTFTNRFGEAHRKSEGPFDQARSGHDALRAAISSHLDRPTLRNICWGWGVVFPDIDFDQSCVAWSPELIADYPELAGRSDIGRYLRRLARWWRSQGRGHHALADADDLAALCKAMRPDFDKVQSIGAAIDNAVDAVVRLTDEQIDVLDSIDENERIVCIGGAGTGKSFLAVEAARREAASGRSTAVLCRSPVFAAFLRSQICGKSVLVVEYDAIEPLLDKGTQFSCAIIDEAQDLLSSPCMVRIERLVQGGLSGGRWRMFMDPNNQSGLHEPVEPGILNSLKKVSTIHRLRRNCRNTQQIVMQTQLITGADIGVAVIEGQGPPIELFDVEDEPGEAAALEERLTLWLDAGVRPGHITVLSPKHLDDSVAARLSSRVTSRISVVGPQSAFRWPVSTITFATILDFKGLENRCIAIVDLDGFAASDSDMAELYVAMTRAHAGLWIAVPRGRRPLVNRLIAEHAKQMLGKVAKS
jgi:hypothetical protein